LNKKISMPRRAGRPRTSLEGKILAETLASEKQAEEIVAQTINSNTRSIMVFEAASLLRQIQQGTHHLAIESRQEADAKLKAETAARQKKARRSAARILPRSKQVRTHPYLKAKHVQAHGDLREYRSALVLPLHDVNGDLHTLQFIGADGQKKFLTGGKVSGCFFTLADKAEGPLVLCEGYATGASIYEATGYAVIQRQSARNGESGA
jgi:putative DNA primase/helicase